MGRNKQSGGQSRGREKIVLEFNEENRREFLTGFRKRKLERKARARKEIEDKLLKERKAIKADIKENFFNQFKKSFAPIPELEEQEEDKEEEYEDDEVKVKIVELSTSDLARENNWIGANRGKLQESSEEEEESEAEEPEEAVPGMSVTAPKAPKKSKDASTEKKNEKELKEIKSKKDLTRAVRDQTSKLIKQTKAFKMKNRLDMMKSRKKARGEKRKKIHVLKNQSKKRGGKHKALLRKSKPERKNRGSEK